MESFKQLADRILDHQGKIANAICTDLTKGSGNVVENYDIFQQKYPNLEKALKLFLNQSFDR